MDAIEIYAVDMRPKRRALGLTQEELAQRVGYTREHLSAVESRRAPCPMRMAVGCARELGSITLDAGGELFTICPRDCGPGGSRDHIPDDDELHDLNGVEHPLNVKKQASDVVAIADRLASNPVLYRSEASRNDRIAGYKELFDLDCAVRGWLREGKQTHPDEVAEGRARFLAERSELEEAGGIGQVA